MASEKPTSLTPGGLLSRTRRIEIRTSRLVNELFGGKYHSTFKGRGMEFSDIREYVPGDDVRSIHWNVTARLGQPFVKRFVEERELTMLIAVDVSRSQTFGTRERLKSELAAELVAVLSLAALKNNDKIGLLLFSDVVETYLPPRKSRRHTLRLIRDVLGFVPERPGTNLNAALQYINRVQKKRAIVFLLSDFLDADYEKSLSITQRHHDTIAFVLEDPMERHWPPVGRIVLDDAETGNRVVLRGGKKEFFDFYARKSAESAMKRDALLAKLNVDRVLFQTNTDYVKPLMQFFQERTRRFRL